MSRHELEATITNYRNDYPPEVLETLRAIHGSLTEGPCAEALEELADKVDNLETILDGMNEVLDKLTDKVDNIEETLDE